MLKIREFSLVFFLKTMTKYRFCVIIDIVGTCNLNVWNGNFNPQIIIEEYDIIHRLTYYF